MSSWMRTDVDFGVPWKRFVVPMRSQWGQAFLSRVKTMEAQDKPEVLADLIRGIVLEARPSLSPQGLVVTGMQEQTLQRAMLWECIHPSFERQLDGSRAVSESLECCPVCREPMPLDSQLWCETDIHKQHYGKLLCSEACGKVLEHSKPGVLEYDQSHDQYREESIIKHAKRLWPGIDFTQFQHANTESVPIESGEGVVLPEEPENRRAAMYRELKGRMVGVDLASGEDHTVKTVIVDGEVIHREDPQLSAGARAVTETGEPMVEYDPQVPVFGVPRMAAVVNAISDVGGLPVLVAAKFERAWDAMTRKLAADIDVAILNPAMVFGGRLERDANAATLPKSEWIGQWPGNKDVKARVKVSDGSIADAIITMSADQFLSQEDEAELDRQTEMAVMRLQVTAEYAPSYRTGLRRAMLEEKRLMPAVIEDVEPGDGIQVKMQELLPRVLRLRDGQQRLGRYGPFTLFLPQRLWDRVDDDYILGDGSTCQTYRQRLLAVNGVDWLALDAEPTAFTTLAAAAEFNQRSKGK